MWLVYKVRSTAVCDRENVCLRCYFRRVRPDTQMLCAQAGTKTAWVEHGRPWRISTSATSGGAKCLGPTFKELVPVQVSVEVSIQGSIEGRGARTRSEEVSLATGSWPVAVETIVSLIGRRKPKPRNARSEPLQLDVDATFSIGRFIGLSYLESSSKVPLSGHHNTTKTSPTAVSLCLVTRLTSEGGADKFFRIMLIGHGKFHLPFLEPCDGLPASDKPRAQEANGRPNPCTPQLPSHQGSSHFPHWGSRYGDSRSNHFHFSRRYYILNHHENVTDGSLLQQYAW
ncbi:hypothetical protein B0T21DRAFT_353070 [Apiosordaria backusii]|uniref:Uncharacterized protein n=1 Tax=Apiosordaria backusii TaxID=314023 RepID=A0AA39ZY55_9PEZI|nr:hypothetical protein B0T21DRAFT_353070 [Apiosordaria backusii]